MSATSIAGGFLVFLYEKNWLEAIIKDVSGGSHLIFVIMEKKNRYGDLFFNIIDYFFNKSRISASNSS
ncbi:hypothetical protein FAJ40_10710 [Streptococcus suis]|nr:hypothetical protein FAJ40_10710 [Streptococcus suis]